MKNKRFWILIGIGVFLVTLLILVSSIISIGERLRMGWEYEYIEYLFYGLSFLLIYFLILNPIRIIVFAPTVSVQSVLEKDLKKNRRVYKKMAKNIIESDMLSEIDVEKLKNALNKDEVLQEELSRLFNHTIKKELDKIIIRNAKTVLISTAISQNGKLDLFTVLAVNLKMVKELVIKCGFRPSYANLGKLSLNVLTTALIAEGLENINLEDLIPQSTSNIFSEIPFIKPIMSSVIQGISNALLTIRIGIVSRKYLFSDTKVLSKSQIRIEALKESIVVLPNVIKDSLSLFPNKIKNLFKGDKLEEEKA